MTKTLAVHYADNTYKTPCGRTPMAQLEHATSFLTPGLSHVTTSADWDTVTCATCRKLQPIETPVQVAVPEWMTVQRTDAELRALAGDRSVWTPTVHRGRIIAHRAARFRREGDAFMGFYRTERDPADYNRAMRHYALAFQTESNQP